MWRHRRARISRISKYRYNNRIPPAKIYLNAKFQVFIPFSGEIMRRYFNHHNSRTNNFQTMFLTWILISIKFPFQRCIIWLFLNSLIFCPIMTSYRKWGLNRGMVVISFLATGWFSILSESSEKSLTRCKNFYAGVMDLCILPWLIPTT